MIDGQPVLLTKCCIDGKDDRYSVYDIIADGDMVYAATSQGLYGMRRDAAHPVRLYPLDGTDGESDICPLVVKNLCMTGNCIMAASHDGLIRLDRRTGHVTVSHKGHDIHCVSAGDGCTYALSDGRLFIDSLGTDASREVDISFPARHHREVNGTHYFIESNRVVLSENLKDFVPIPLRHKVPLYGGGIICTGRRDGFTLMVTENALWRIPHHIGVFNVSGEIVAACSDGTNAYYVNSANELFCQKDGASVADKIYDIPEGETLSSIMVAGGMLYGVSNGDKLVRMGVGGNYLRNSITSAAETLYEAPTKITAACMQAGSDGHRVYLGIQDELVAIDGDGIADTVSELSGKYITSFNVRGSDGPVYMSTLNDGIFYGRESRFRQLPGTSGTSFIRDIALTGEHIPLLMMLTNHQLILHEQRDTIGVKGFNKLLYVNDSLFYALPETGLCEYAVEDGHCVLLGEYFSDIHFNPQASFVMGDRLCLGSDIGVLQMPAGNASEAEWVQLCSDVPNVRIVMTLLVFVLVLAVVTAVAYRKRRNSRIKMVRMHIDDLRSRLKSLKVMADVTGNIKGSGIDELRQEVEDIDTDSRNAPDIISALSMRIMQKNRDMALVLSKHLDRQMEDIGVYDVYDRPLLLEESRMAAVMGDTEHIMEQVEKNAAWLDRMGIVTDRMRKYKAGTEGILQIEGVSDGLPEEVADMDKALHEQPLVGLNAALEQLDRRYKYIFTDEALGRIDAYIVSRTDAIIDSPAYDDVEAALVAMVYEQRSALTRSERTAMLRELRLTDSRISQVFVRRDIAAAMHEYVAIRQQVLESKGIDTAGKPDMSVEIEIADKAQPVVERIERLIATFYKLMVETDGNVMTEVMRFSKFTYQSARVLALLVAWPDADRNMLPGMLGMFGSMRPVISRLMKNRIGVCLSELEVYVRKNPASMVKYIVMLVE